MIINTHGLVETEAQRDTITTSPFMTTTDNGFAVTDSSEEPGEYILGAVATETISSAEETGEGSEESRLTVISGASMIDAQITDTFPTLENTTLFMNTVTANFDGVKNVSIEPKSLTVEYNTVRYGGWLSLFLIFGVPLAILAAGFVVWLRRKKA